MKALVLISAVVFAVLFYREYQLVKEQKVNAWSESQSADCAVVLTGGAGRVREGIDLLYKNQVKKLIISGVHPKATLSEIFPRLPFYGDLEREDIVLEKHSGTTYGNARQSLPLAEALRCRDVILVTSRLHMYRTRRTFEAAFPEEIQLESRAIGEAGTSQGGWAILSEVLKSLFYSIWAY